MAADDRNRGINDRTGDDRPKDDRPKDDRYVGNATGPGAGGPIDQPDEGFGIPGSEEAGGLGTGPLPPRQPDRPQGQTTRGTEPGSSDRIVSDRNVAVDGARDRK